MKRVIGGFLRYAIMSKNMTQKQVAKKLNVTPQSLSSYVTGKRNPSLECFFDMIELLDLDMLFLNAMIVEKMPSDDHLLESIQKLKGDQKTIIMLILRYFDKVNKKK